jgi:hypothetical protein
MRHMQIVKTTGHVPNPVHIQWSGIYNGNICYIYGI